MARSTKTGGSGKSKKNRKYTRNKIFCTRYRNEGRREVNKARRNARHVRRFPNDLQAQE